ncbi:MAG: c-type cytochrome [Vicinamibacterales bacterium]
MNSRLVTAIAISAFAASASAADVRRGGEVYRACVPCHSLEPGVHLTGPSLARAFGRAVGKAEGFDRYSAGMKAATFEWDENTLDAWLANPQSMIPGTYMVFPGIGDERARADLVAFLAIAMASGGADAIVARRLVSPEYVRGQTPEPLVPAAVEQTVTAIRHCRDSYFVTTADGSETPFFEMNVRLKIDSRSTGPEAGKPVIVGAGMMGDRMSVIFAGIADLERFLVEQC